MGSLQQLKRLLKQLNEYGEAIEFEKMDQGQAPRNYIGPIYEFFTNLIEQLDNPAYFPCLTTHISSRGKSIALELKCLSTN